MTVGHLGATVTAPTIAAAIAVAAAGQELETISQWRSSSRTCGAAAGAPTSLAAAAAVEDEVAAAAAAIAAAAAAIAVSK
jgi:hypothetical protein